MTRYQNTVIWLGLVLVTLNLLIHIADLKTLLFGGTTGKTEGNPAQAPQGQQATPAPNQVQTPTPAPNQSPAPPPTPTGGTPILTLWQLSKQPSSLVTISSSRQR